MQADVCHAYQILRKGGVSDKNIIVFMYDDIASNRNNPMPGVIINKPNGKDVYRGVPKVITLHTHTHTHTHIYFNTYLINYPTG